jgi:hypothetical protein
MLPVMGPRSDRDPASFVPPDSHVHSEWSWDADVGSMEDSCARAVELGLTSIAFTEHWDPTPCPIEPSAVAHLPADMRRFVSTDGVFLPPASATLPGAMAACEHSESGASCPAKPGIRSASVTAWLLHLSPVGLCRSQRRQGLLRLGLPWSHAVECALDGSNCASRSISCQKTLTV